MARELHWPSVEQGLETISASELVEWQAYFSIYPFAEVREDYHAGLIASSVYNVNRSKSSDKVLNPADFMPDFLMLVEEKPKINNKPDDQEFQNKLRVFRLLVG